MSIQQQSELSRENIAVVFRRYPGSQSKIAGQLGIRSGAVSQWLAGKMGSKRIEKACRSLALRLLRKEVEEPAKVA